MKKTLVDKRTSSQSSASDYNITFDGFDTLDGTVQNAKAKDMQSYMMIKEQAAKNVAGGITLDKRVKEVLRSLLGAEVGTMVPLTKEQCDAVCKSGLVVELMFLPYAGLRDYVAATLNTSSQLY
ncbi:hypothetical protein K435DRAFT_775526 [Dendrothele bispora CBS 962.96]|uniref:Uncharacterized protein n=1 Tax=Dendrothele bispora (strain CBS 962.96) TaxID=1314807 RepID=A0A4S8MIK8_DENBC|nr:hypothetical protein K435DRAFT_775526 [Dendrothele bispora CBS 962.96]